jgi:DNA-binding CsgD family transcriptional regulator/PAS domain-containing protein
MPTLAPERFSDIIGLVYDCAVEPDQWPAAIAGICQAIGCLSGIILLIDLQTSRHRFAHTWGAGTDWAQRYLEYSDELTPFYQNVFSRKICPDGEPLVLAPFIDAMGPRAQRIYTELTQPQGISDMIQTVVLREERRLAVFGVNRHQSVGAPADDELAIIRLLVPHIRRAVAISDILDMKKLEAHALATTLDTYTAGVVVVADRGRILHANDAARRMFSAATTVSAVNGFLKAHDIEANGKLTNAIELAQHDEATIGAAGIGVALKTSTGEPSIAHVLPLARGNLRTRLVPKAAAAVFITQAPGPPPADIAAVADSYGLTAAETRMLEQLVHSATVADTASALGISMNTARSHLAHIFSKTGLSRQADLVALVNRLVPQVRRPTHD